VVIVKRILMIAYQRWTRVCRVMVGGCAWTASTPTIVCVNPVGLALTASYQ